MRILLIEDENKAAAFIRKGLTEEGYGVDVSPDGEGALEASRAHDYGLVILDLMLPRMDGLEVCRILRSEGLRAPILMLTAKDTPDDKVAGLDSGADDYLTKPFHFTELLARVRALLRRVRAPGEPLPRARLLAHAWREEEEVLTNIVDVYVSRLRRKLDEDPRKPLILTEHAVGYRLVVEEEK
jgi:DNA-binding response OmpR family regulator